MDNYFELFEIINLRKLNPPSKSPSKGGLNGINTIYENTIIISILPIHYESIGTGSDSHTRYNLFENK